VATQASPAERYAATRRRQAEDGPELAAFRALYDFSFDDFQVDACRALSAGHGVLLAAPTGSGKTVVGEFAVHLALAGLGYVVLDEVHYLADRFRGAVWEEVIIHLPDSVRVVALSATVSNAEEFGEWLTQVRGGTTVIVDEHRPVPLWQHVLADGYLYDLFVSPNGRGPGNQDSP